MISFAEKLAIWYYKNKRDLPWRHTSNPYLIWLSEVILQQTRVAQGLPYYLKFIAAFPTVQDMANANEATILRLWQGLGYYSRARNMHKTALNITSNFKGEFPQTYLELLKLTGIGTYTAAAIASFSFNERVAVLDGNVYRVLSRYFANNTDISSPIAKKIFTELANQVLPQTNTNEHNQAIMELGALVCSPKNPNCFACPLESTCQANILGQQINFPVKNKKVKVRERVLNYVLIEYEGKIAMRKRNKNEIWEGLYEFMLFENVKNEPVLRFEEVDLPETLLKNTQLMHVSEQKKHILTHQKLFVTFFYFKIEKEFLSALKNMLIGYSFYDFEEIQRLPKPILLANYWDTIKI